MKKNILSVGIFFDGTGNNGLNASCPEKPTRNNESYCGAFTNIYKLFSLFNGDKKLYIEGIGTVTGSEDSDFAMATCKNPSSRSGYSSDDKLQKALGFAKNKLSDPGTEYHFYVYGFSRGAMLARNFCRQLAGEHSVFSGHDIKIKFLGLFDTVESAAFNDYQVGILPETERVLHICAANECRYFFPLTGLSEDSGTRGDSEYRTGHALWKEIFVPGAHADVGGGYLEASQSVYISPNFTDNHELFYYVESIRATAEDAFGNKKWGCLLENYGIDHDEVSSQIYLARDWVSNELPKVYGKLMVTETNAASHVFRTDFSGADFEIDARNHAYLLELSASLEKYLKDLSPAARPQYSYEKLADYIHISANFGLYHPAILEGSKSDAYAEFINNGLNVPSHSDDQYPKNQARLQSEIHHIEDAVVDYAYGTNIPNNDNWNRTILIKENFYNKC